ncbi:hypothetical protein [Citrobacter amalonaticus]|uniref:hypothetical protein n=1 Tax=Citrobacter amalonaticus TaxID=35703 RepID=UPI00076B331E|nr:hypothetical protein [Citrobacter amalonaticus]AMG94612.1 hypothetical protein AL479_19965 [Citrobacter amalonaticus]HED1254070.1 hypothetical protein [Citrobacter amalonaticus]
MSSRIINPESYIFSAINYINSSNFTSTDIAKILVKRFNLPKTYFKAKAFSYSQLQILVKRGLLTKTRQKGIYQNLYSETTAFQTAITSVELIDLSISLSNIAIFPDEIKINSDIRSILKEMINKYTNELEKISGAKEIYDELCINVPAREQEFKKLSSEQERRYIRVNEKINTLMNIVDEPSFLYN